MRLRTRALSAIMLPLGSLEAPAQTLPVTANRADGAQAERSGVLLIGWNAPSLQAELAKR
ncbi:MAG: hypothetical protein M3P27_00270 [Acidobacteriota bacterium]|nr:hypothetical protein [Acidobacteriota bacterium]